MALLGFGGLEMCDCVSWGNAKAPGFVQNGCRRFVRLFSNQRSDSPSRASRRQSARRFRGRKFHLHQRHECLLQNILRLAVTEAGRAAMPRSIPPPSRRRASRTSGFDHVLPSFQSIDNSRAEFV